MPYSFIFISILILFLLFFKKTFIKWPYIFSLLAIDFGFFSSSLIINNTISINLFFLSGYLMIIFLSIKKDDELIKSIFIIFLITFLYKLALDKSYDFNCEINYTYFSIFLIIINLPFLFNIKQIIFNILLTCLSFSIINMFYNINLIAFSNLINLEILVPISIALSFYILLNLIASYFIFLNNYKEMVKYAK